MKTQSDPKVSKCSGGEVKHSIIIPLPRTVSPFDQIGLPRTIQFEK
jgi:hypothetical protein